MARKATPKLSTAIDDFLRIRTRQSGSPHRALLAYRSSLSRFTRSTGDIHVGSVRPEHIEDHFYGPGGLSDTCSPQTIAGYRNHLKQFLDFCHRRGWTEHTGTYLVSGVIERNTKRNRERFRMSRRELIRLMDSADNPRDRALVSFVVNTACRIGEAITVTIGDIRLDRGEVYVRRHKTREETTFPVTSDLDVELRKWLTEYGKTLGAPLEGHFKLFPPKNHRAFGPGGKLPAPEDVGWNPTGKLSNARDIIRPIARRANLELEPGDGWHTIRRSVARIFFDEASASGYDRALRLTQALLGHRNTQTTEVYLGLQVETQQVNRILRGKPFISKGLEGSNVASLDERRVSA